MRRNDTIIFSPTFLAINTIFPVSCLQWDVLANLHLQVEGVFFYLGVLMDAWQKYQLRIIAPSYNSVLITRFQVLIQ